MRWSSASSWPRTAPTRRAASFEVLHQNVDLGESRIALIEHLRLVLGTPGGPAGVVPVELGNVHLRVLGHFIVVCALEGFDAIANDLAAILVYC